MFVSTFANRGAFVRGQLRPISCTSAGMRYFALATDYDGTLARDGIVAPETIQALEKLRHSGRKLILVTGREVGDLETVYDRLDIFERVVAENGAVLFNPASKETHALAKAPRLNSSKGCVREALPISVRAR